ncbi:hypothetical protein [Streptomyces sp. NPDC005181]|uniref:hypothetical protein n=1 Tax=Streptomyces sp. NPDC005181 TaxID=3156869 RepID=UPI0033BB97B1
MPPHGKAVGKACGKATAVRAGPNTVGPGGDDACTCATPASAVIPENADQTANHQALAG